MKTIKTYHRVLAAFLCTCFLTGCSSTPTSKNESGASSAVTNAAVSRRLPVIAERPARIYIWAGFNPDDCTPITPKLTVAQQPSKGAITFRLNQMTKIKQSTSGKCIGQSVYGTGIYYTARKGQTGSDQFSINATTAGDPPVTRTFILTIEN